MQRACAVRAVVLIQRTGLSWSPARARTPGWKSGVPWRPRTEQAVAALTGAPSWQPVLAQRFGAMVWKTVRAELTSAVEVRGVCGRVWEERGAPAERHWVLARRCWSERRSR